MADLSGMSDAELEAAIRAKMSAAPSRKPMPKFNSKLTGFVDAATAPVGNVLGWVDAGLKKVGVDGGLPIPSFYGGGTIGERNAMQRERLDANQSESGKLAGQYVTSLATLPMKGGAALGGALQGAVNSRADNPAGVAEDAVWGAAGSVAGEKAVNALGKVISPTLRPAVARLKARKIPVTPGQALGGLAKKAEDLAMSIPLVGPAISNARKAGLAAFEEAAGNEVVDPIRGSIPPGTAGRGVVQAARGQIRDSYRNLTPKLGAQLDSTFLTRMGATRARAGLTPEMAAKFDDVVQRELAGAFDPSTGKITGKSFKRIEERLGDLSSSWLKSDDPFERDLGNAVGDVRGHLFDMLSRQNKPAAAQLRATNRAYARLQGLQNAAGTAAGDITPARLYAGIQAADRTAGKGMARRGEADLSQLAQDGFDVLGRAEPNSGTTDRALFAGGLGLLGTGAATVSPAVAGAGLLAVPYLPGVRKGTEWLFTGRQGPGARMIGRNVRRLAPLVGASVPPLLARPQD